jgi:hypothetical protein
LARLVLLLLWMAAGVFGQEAKRSLAGDPATLVADLLGPAEQRQAALRRLACDPKASVGTAQLLEAQLDTDMELEALVRAGIAAGTVSRVCDRGGGAWWEVGKLDWPWRMEMELRELVGAGAKDSVLRVSGPGSGGGCAESGSRGCITCIRVSSVTCLK